MRTRAYVKADCGSSAGTLNVYGADLLPGDFDAAMTAAKLAANGWGEGPKFGSQTMWILPSAKASNPPEAVPSARVLAARVGLRTRSAERAARAVLQGRGYTVRKGPK